MRIVQRKFGWREVGDEEDWEIYWTDTSVSIERVMKLSKTQVRGGGAVQTGGEYRQGRVMLGLGGQPGVGSRGEREGSGRRWCKDGGREVGCNR